MMIIFRDWEVVDESGDVLLSFNQIDNIKLYLFINYLVENENQLNLVLESEKPISIKLFELLSEELSIETTSPSWEF